MDEMASNSVEHTVDVTSALGRAVYLGQIHIFVDGDADGDVGERHHLGQCNLHNHHVHIGQSREVPVAACLGHVALILVGIQDGSPEQLASEVLVLDVLVFGQQRLAAAVFWIEALDARSAFS